MLYQQFEIPAGINGDAHRAVLTTYFIGNSQELYDGRLRPAILICPGGGYAMTSDREAEGVALKYMAMGFHAAVLRYSVAPAVYPTALLQLAGAVALLRKHWAEWYIDPDRITVAGFSAGGHLAACLGCFWQRGFLQTAWEEESGQFQPNAQILCYPVITSGEFGHQESFKNLLGGDYEAMKGGLSLETQVNADNPRTFLWHTYTDGTVPVENSLLYLGALRKHRIPAEFHMYAQGTHGLGTADELSRSADGRGVQEECENWMELSRVWLRGGISENGDKG